VSHGCLRLYPEDIPRLFRLVEVGARVAIVREPVKVGVREGRVYVEVHDDETVTLPPMEQAVRLLRRRGVLDRVDPGKLARAVLARSGLPVNVSGDAGRGERATGATAGRGPARPAAGR
jgi:L,D-transpeptidase ErfK/SrfK